MMAVSSRSEYIGRTVGDPEECQGLKDAIPSLAGVSTSHFGVERRNGSVTVATLATIATALSGSLSTIEAEAERPERNSG